MNIYIRTKQDLIDAVKEIGILPFFSNSIPGFSIEENCAPEAWFSDAEGVWEWKGPVIQETGCAYGKFFSSRAAFISFRWYPYFCCWRRDGYDFDARVDDGLASYKEQYLYDLISSHHSILSKDAKIQGGYLKPKSTSADAWQPRKGFESTVTKLQMLGYVTTTDFEYEIDKKGNFYGWGIARYAVPENHFGKKFTDRVYRYTPQQSYQKIVSHLRKLLPGVKENEIEYFLNHK